MREIVHMQAGQCGNQIGAKVSHFFLLRPRIAYPVLLTLIKRRGPFSSTQWGSLILYPIKGKIKIEYKALIHCFEEQSYCLKTLENAKVAV